MFRRVGLLKTRIMNVGLISVLVTAMMSYAAYAGSFSKHNDRNSPWLLAKADVITLEEAVKKAKRKNKGKVLSAKKRKIDGAVVFKIKMILPDSRVKTIFVDGETGDIMKRSRML